MGSVASSAAGLTGMLEKHDEHSGRHQRTSALEFDDQLSEMLKQADHELNSLAPALDNSTAPAGGGNFFATDVQDLGP